MEIQKNKFYKLSQIEEKKYFNLKELLIFEQLREQLFELTPF